MKLNGLYRENIVNDICLKLLESGKLVLNLDFIKLFKEVNDVGAKQLSFLE